MSDDPTKDLDQIRMERGAAMAAKMFGRAPSSSGGGGTSSKFAEFSMRHLFGDLWTGDDLELQDRSLVTCTTLVALYRLNEQRVHFVAARNLGVPRARLEGMINQVAHYAGWPCAASATQVLNEVWPVEG
jgi:4-carboxymuconolactone decarboxylase